MGAAERALTTPSVVIDNESIAIIPESLKHTPGFGEVVLRTQSSGGGNVQLVKSINAETKKGKVSFGLLPTKKNNDFIDKWQDAGRGDGVGIEISDGSFTKSYRNMYVTNDPERNLSSDGDMVPEFEGSPIVG